jgi:hypothetical protein
MALVLRALADTGTFVNPGASMDGGPLPIVSGKRGLEKGLDSSVLLATGSADKSCYVYDVTSGNVSVSLPSRPRMSEVSRARNIEVEC